MDTTSSDRNDHDPKALESFHARWQHSFAASLVGRTIAALDDNHGESLLCRDDCDRETRRSSTDYDEIP